MKCAIATIYTHFTSECVNPNVRTPIEIDKRSTIGERHPLLLRFEAAKEGRILNGRLSGEEGRVLS